MLEKRLHKKTAIELHDRTGAEMVVQALIDQGVTDIFAYPGGAVLPIFDALHQQNKIKTFIVRHEQAAGHAAEGYARSTGKVGVVLVTSGPGVTNMITPLQDALMDSVPLVCISGQVSTALIGTEAFQECDTIGITRPCTKHNWLVQRVEDLSFILHKAFEVAQSGRPGPVLVDIPKNIQCALGRYESSKRIDCDLLQKKSVDKNDMDGENKLDSAIKQAVIALLNAQKPIVYSGGGVINSGLKAVTLLRELVSLGNFPITSTLMGLGAYSAEDANWLGMLGMHGTYEANLAMHGCDLMLCVGARFDDRITGSLDKFSPGSFKIHIDIDETSISKIIPVDMGLVGDAGFILEKLLKEFKASLSKKTILTSWWQQINKWRKKNCLFFSQNSEKILPQYALERLFLLSKDRNPYITTEVGQHQMWTAQYYKFKLPFHFLTSGGAGTMGYGFPAAIGAQIAHPKDTVICVAGDASIQMNIQELGTVMQYRLPIKIFILNNQYMGMVRQWQQLIYDNRLAQSYSESLPDFIRLAEAYGALGLRCDVASDLDAKISELLEFDGPVILDCRVVPLENCFPMILSGSAHSEILIKEDALQEKIRDCKKAVDCI